MTVNIRENVIDDVRQIEAKTTDFAKKLMSQSQNAR